MTPSPRPPRPTPRSARWAPCSRSRAAPRWRPRRRLADPAQGQDPVVMAQLAGPVTDASAGAVAARTGLRVESTLPEIGWAVYGIDGDVRGGAPAPAPRPGRDADRLRGPGRAQRPRLHAARHHHDPARPRSPWAGSSRPGTGTGSRRTSRRPGTSRRGSSSVRVAVIDSEFDTEHPDLKTKLATGRNFDSGTANYGTSNVRAETIDTAFHGSHVAGLVGAATDNGEGVPGACFDCVVIPFKIGFGGQPNVDDKFVRDLTEALVAAGNSDAAVINMSLGTSRDHPPLRAAVDYARPARQGRGGLGRQLAARRAGPRRRAELPGRLPGRHRGGLHAARRQHLARLDQRRLRGHRRSGQPDPLDLGHAPRRERRAASSPRPTASATRCSPGPRWRRRSWPGSRR